MLHVGSIHSNIHPHIRISAQKTHYSQIDTYIENAQLFAAALLVFALRYFFSSFVDIFYIHRFCVHLALYAYMIFAPQPIFFPVAFCHRIFLYKPPPPAQHLTSPMIIKHRTIISIATCCSLCMRKCKKRDSNNNACCAASVFFIRHWCLGLDFGNAQFFSHIPLACLVCSWQSVCVCFVCLDVMPPGFYICRFGERRLGRRTLVLMMMYSTKIGI